MIKRVKTSAMSFRALVAGGLIAGAVGFASAEGGSAYGSPAGNYGEPGGTGVTEEEKGTGGAGMDKASATTLPPNVAPGWKIRVCSEKTKAQSINFMFSHGDKEKTKASEKTYGTGGTGATDASGAGTGATDASGTGTMASATETATWQAGDPSIITIPEQLSTVEKIRIQATPDRKDAKSEVCVLYNDHVAKKVSFDNKNETTVKATETGTCSC